MGNKKIQPAGLRNVQTGGLDFFFYSSSTLLTSSRELIFLTRP